MHSIDERFISIRKEIQSRIFIVEILRMSNGCFVSVSEDSKPRIALVTLSISTGDQVRTSSLLPERRGSLFSATIGEILARKTNGVVLASVYLREEIDHEIMKTLINEIDKMLPGRT